MRQCNSVSSTIAPISGCARSSSCYLPTHRASGHLVWLEGSRLSRLFYRLNLRVGCWHDQSADTAYKEIWRPRGKPFELTTFTFPLSFLFLSGFINIIMANTRLAVVASTLFALFARTVIGDTCATVAGTTAIDIKQRFALEYTSEQLNYWSTGCGNLKPSCQLYPTTANEVAAIVKILHGNNDTFAIKSGGHNANKYFASIDGGPLISTKKLNEVTFDADSMTVRVGPGNDWQDVHQALEGTGVTVVGGRIGEVGVGGYVVGGGLSFLSTQYAWAANNIVECEVVLANASIVTASSTHNSDLWKALKGGGNGYGIVTAYTMVAHPQGEVSTVVVEVPIAEATGFCRRTREHARFVSITC